MSLHDNELYFDNALKDGELVHIDEVANGLACECVCPHCETKVVAYNNSKNKIAHHFKHYSHSDCRNYYETMLHYLAKKVIEELGGLAIPEITYSLPDYARSYFDQEWLLDAKRPRKTARHITFDSIQVEKYENGIQPDLICVKDGKSMRIEIAVTHFVDEIKKSKIKELGIAVLEIDLSKLNRTMQKEELKKTISGNIKLMNWIHNPINIEREKAYLTKLNSISDFLLPHLREYKVYGKNNRIYKCPEMTNPDSEVDISNCRSCRYLAFETERFEYRPDFDDERPSHPQLYIGCIGHASKVFNQLLDSHNVVYKDNKAFGK